MKTYFASELLIVGAIVLLMLAPACRKERPPLDRNKAPETFITKSPTETTATDYRVHMYWRGADEDGIVTRYIYYISDTLVTLDPERNPDAEALDWNPSERIADFLKGKETTGTDMIVNFTGYNEKRNVGENKQAFHIAAIDDEGRIDPTPARLQFNARVRGLPQVRFWTKLTSVGNKYEPYDSEAAADTISWRVPFSIKFTGSTVNNEITGYRWSYGDKVFPSYNSWKPAGRFDSVTVSLPDTTNEVIPSGEFIFKVTARDEAGALSETNTQKGQGVCKVVVNHDPNTRILNGRSFFTPQSSEMLDSLDVDFSDGIPDTLPYRSILTMFYLGWDDPKDMSHLKYNNPALPIRFQFRYYRVTQNEDSLPVAEKTSPWYPLGNPEDTNPGAEMEPNNPLSIINRDSTSMRVATFNYNFFVRSFDEQDKADGTPAVVSFVANFPPVLDSVQAGFYDPRTLEFHSAENDTMILIGWMCGLNASCGDKISPYAIKLNAQTKILTKSFKFVIRAGGRDDRRDPPGSGIKGWRYKVTDEEDDLTYYKENEWMFDRPLNTFEQECRFDIIVPFKSNVDSMSAQADSLVAHPPAFLGHQDVELVGSDIKDNELFPEEIRGISPRFVKVGDQWIKIPGNYMIIKNEYYFANYARKVTKKFTIYLKLVR